MRQAALFLPALIGGTTAGILVADAGLLPGTVAALLPAAAIASVVGATITRSAPATLLAGALIGLAVGTWRGAGSTLPTGPGSVAALVGHDECQL